MVLQAEQLALLAYLKAKDAVYYGKILELRDSVRGWLDYIPQTFRHYASHTLDHSDEIVLQLSKIVFKNNEPAQHMLGLSAVEAYILAAAAYRHDVGMVASDQEQRDTRLGRLE